MSGLDAKNEQILQVLTQDGRISNLDLADRVNLSPSACLRRVQDLEKRGLITGYRAVVDRTKLGIGFIAYLGVGLNDHSKSSQEAFERAAAQAPEVRECHNTTGTLEYFLRVECADMRSYKEFHTNVLGALPQVNALTTYVVIASPKDERA